MNKIVTIELNTLTNENKNIKERLATNPNMDSNIKHIMNLSGIGGLSGGHYEKFIS